MTFKSQPLQFNHRTEVDQRKRAESFYELMRTRRSIRSFSDRPVPIEVLRNCIATAATAPSGANKQPWTFALVTDPNLKQKIREAAEAEERAFYSGRASQRWLDDLAHLGTDHEKPHLTTASALIVVFAQRYGDDAGDQHYYVSESVGIAVGMLISALHNAGLATLTHTPSPMGFLRDVLNRPENEKAYVLLPVGYPSETCEVPVVTKKPLSEVLVEYSKASLG